MKTSFILLLLAFSASLSLAQEPICRPTAPDLLGPFYRPDAPVRAKVGEGYLLSGVVQSASDCSPISGATIEYWLTGPDGQYDMEHRGIVFSGPPGTYRFETNFPSRYGGRPPHIHLRITAPRHLPLVTQHYPEPGTTFGEKDLVLLPEP